MIRDRLGQKPLYLNFNNKRVDFGSNLISLLKISKNTSLDEQEIYNYLAYGINNSPKTLFKSITKVKPGEIVSIDLGKINFLSPNLTIGTLKIIKMKKILMKKSF